MNTIDIILASKARDSRQSKEHECVWREDAPDSQSQPATRREGNDRTRQSAFESGCFAAQLEAYTQTETQDQTEESARSGLPAIAPETETADTVHEIDEAHPGIDEAHIDWVSVAFFAYTGHTPTDAGETERIADAPSATVGQPTGPALPETLVMTEPGQPGQTNLTDRTDQTGQTEQADQTDLTGQTEQADQTDRTDQTDQTDTTPIDPIGIATDAPPVSIPPSQAATEPSQDETKAQPLPPSAPPVATEAPDARAELVASLPAGMPDDPQREERDNNQQSPGKHAALRPQPGIPEGDATNSLTAAANTLQTDSAARVSPSPTPTALESPAATMDIKRFIEQFDHLTLRTMRSDDQRLRIELEPAALGKLVLQCKETPGGLSIELSVQGEAVHALLVGQEADLRASLASQGVQVGQFSVSCQDRDGRPTDQQNADTPNTFGRLHVQPPQLAASPAPARRLASWERNRWVA